MAENLIHATAVACEGKAVLLRGPSGAGKSDLALRLVERGWALVSDDQTRLDASDDELIASPPQTIVGQIEARGLGIVDLRQHGHQVLDRAEVVLLVDLVSKVLDRVPEWEAETLFGVPLPRISINPFENSAVAKLELAMESLASLRSSVPPEAVEAGSSDAESPDAERLVVVTGISGAGRSVALRLLEDLGYEAIDNLPLDLIRTIVEARSLASAVVIGVDTRTRGFSAGPVLNELSDLQALPGVTLRVLFMDCDDEVLERRFTETRRRHPLALDRPVADGIAAERRLLEPLRRHADLVLDTTKLKLPEFRRVLAGHFRLEQAAGMSIFVTSFSYREGLPREADLVFDVRFLANPHYQDTLRPLTGLDDLVRRYVISDEGFKDFTDNLARLLGALLPRYRKEGKSYLTLAVGCTGGRHRSIVVAEWLANWLMSEGWSATLTHRDLERNGAASSDRR